MFLNPEQRVHYRVELKQNENIEVTTKLTTLFNSDLLIFGNIYNKTNTRPSEQYYEFKSEGSNGFKVGSEQLTYSCSENPFINEPVNTISSSCYLYLTLQSMADKPFNTTILVKASSQMLYVYDSSSIEVMSPLKTEDLKHFWYDYYNTSEEGIPVTITVYSLYDSLNIYANIFDMYDSSISDFTTLPFPDE